ncbi:ABC transporter substrate-binding protein [Bradyrhizobium sp. CCGB20]|uniref:ABC transporter substrate-binding protein n=1 Tax=Bradyrhizobium sp. CCGB20 TaxID=2949633 RepID=UPI0020B1C5E9|nr:ABC transporter substrate-binding protein [Bradyrhizobium sp. CCGB20]MCP3401592.1 ABC transporter substrate-binding protein [Bradyrhizobium sp. CCGB20]
MRRREFITLVGGAVAWPSAVQAQQPSRVPTVGFLSPNSQAASKAWTAAFVQGLRDLGWIEDRTVIIEYRWEDGQVERTSDLVSELIRLKVAVIVTHGIPNIVAAMKATPTVPVVFPLATDPVGSGLIASLARPGGNVTGLSILSRELAGKRLELLGEMLPALHRLAVMGDPNAFLEMKEVQALAPSAKLDLSMVNVQKAEEIAPAIEKLKGRVDALYVCATPFINTNRFDINSAALAAGLPTMQGFREAVDSGALISYGPNFPDLFRRAANLVDKILRGTKPAEIPVEQPTRFDLVINLRTAKLIGLTLSPMLLARADEVIE